MGEAVRLGKRGLERGEGVFIQTPESELWFAPRDEQVRYILAIELKVVENRKLRITSAPPLSKNSAITRPPCAPLNRLQGRVYCASTDRYVHRSVTGRSKESSGAHAGGGESDDFRPK